MLGRGSEIPERPNAFAPKKKGDPEETNLKDTSMNVLK
jgi:hypothetical protein